MYRRYRDAQACIATLERQWSAARLSALRSQLSPHTLFNLLHTIRGQIGWDPRAAQSMVVQLGDLLRRLLSAGEREYSRLADEIQFARLYLELQQKRFPDRVTLTLPASDGLPEVWVPSLILQPLIENAVVHGLAGHEGPVTIRVEVEGQGEELTLRVTNTIAEAKLVSREGIGLRNVHERLAVQFGTRASLTAAAVDDGTWIARIRLPFLRERPQLDRQAS
jgi:sensor histidine kinase YesM